MIFCSVVAPPLFSLSSLYLSAWFCYFRSIFSFCRLGELRSDWVRTSASSALDWRWIYLRIETWLEEQLCSIVCLGIQIDIYFLAPAIFHTKETNILRLFTIWNRYDLKSKYCNKLQSSEKHKHHSPVRAISIIWLWTIFCVIRCSVVCLYLVNKVRTESSAPLSSVENWRWLLGQKC